MTDRISNITVSFEEYGNGVRDFLRQQRATDELLEYIDSEWLEKSVSDATPVGTIEDI